MALPRTKAARSATTPLATPAAVTGMPGHVPTPIPNAGRRINPTKGQFISKREAERITGIAAKTFYSWQQQGCPGVTDDGVHLGLVAQWRRETGYSEGRDGERMNAASAGTLTVATMEAEKVFHSLMKIKREESRDLGHWMLVQAGELNWGRMLSRVKALLRIMPDVIDPELEIAMGCRCGCNPVSSAKRKAIIREAAEEICRTITMDRVLHGDPEDATIEQRLEEPEDEAESAEDQADRAELDEFLG